MNFKRTGCHAVVFLSALLMISLVTGCATPQQDLIKQGYPPEYAEGYGDGCESGRKAGGNMFDKFKKDVNRFESDVKYADGWKDGFEECKGEQEALDRQIERSIEQQRYQDERKHNSMEREALEGIDTRGLENLGK